MLEYLDETLITAGKITKEPQSRSVSGYGSKLPTQYMILCGKRWYRVYAICFSNVASFYIASEKRRWFVRDHVLQSLKDTGRVR